MATGMLPKASRLRPADDTANLNTLRKMAASAWAGAAMPHVRYLAGMIAGPLAHSAPLVAAVQVRDWLASNVRFVPDPPGRELVVEPEAIASAALHGVPDAVAGDCDDIATFAAALLMALGIGAELEAVAWGDGALAHVFAVAVVEAPGEAPAFVDMDVTAQAQGAASGAPTASRRVIWSITANGGERVA